MLSKDEFQAYLDVRMTKMLMITLYRLGVIDDKIIKGTWATLSTHSFKYSGMQHTNVQTKFKDITELTRVITKKNGC
jgi:hypothetical protein